MWGRAWRWCWWWRPPCLLARVIVNPVHDSTEAFEGVLWSYRGGWMVLKDVSALKANHPPAKMHGDLTIHRSNVAYFQVLR